MTPDFLPPALTLRGTRFDPPLFAAPMAGLTHSACRRVLAGYGGYGALFTEMLCARTVRNEDVLASPWTRRRPGEGKLIYQLLVTEPDGLPAILDRLAPLVPDGIDLNGACAAWNVRQKRGGADLFEDAPRLRAIVRALRAAFAGPLLVKIRLGGSAPDWQARLRDRVRLLADEGVDALTLHPRFTEDKFKRTPHHEVYADLTAVAPLPILANGDITGPASIAARAAAFAPAAGWMIGRMAIACPWVFAAWRHPDLAGDPAAVWSQWVDAIAEDFPHPGRALARVKIFTPYLARHYVFGHTLFVAVQTAPDMAAARERAARFFAARPERHRAPSFKGL